MLADKLQGMIAETMKAHDAVRLDLLRMLKSAFNYERIAKGHELTEEEEFIVIKREAKKRVEAIEGFEKGGAIDRAEKERIELVILKGFLPKEMSDTELRDVIRDVCSELHATDMKMMGAVISRVKEKVGTRADGAKIAGIVKEVLNNVPDL
jgi:uncharacterized protein